MPFSRFAAVAAVVVLLASGTAVAQTAPSAAAGPYGDQQQRSQHGGMNWNVGAGFER